MDSGQPRVFVTRNLPGRAIEVLREQAEVDVWPDGLPPSPEELHERVADVDGLLSLLTDKINEAMLDAAPKLLVVSNMATGFDNVEIAAANKHGVLVTRTPGVLSETTADFAFALMLTAARRVVEGDRYVHAGHWKTWGTRDAVGPGRLRRDAGNRGDGRHRH